MQKTRSILFCTAVMLLVYMSACKNKTSNSRIEKTRVLLIAGGHSFDTTEFVEIFTEFDQIIFDTLMQPNANNMIAKNLVNDYDVFIFYDMWPIADSLERLGYEQLMEKGKGFVFLHHSLCSYQDWDAFKSIVGGKYNTEWSGAPDSLLSTFKHDIEIPVHVSKEQHPVTDGLSDFLIHDEGYGNIQVNEDVEIFLSTDHPDCSNAMAWANTYKKSKIVYIMLGHDALAYANEDFQRLIKNAISYVAEKGSTPSDDR